MKPEIFYMILSIVGFFCVLGLGINAYFVKGMLDSLNQVKLQTAVLIEKSKGVSKNEEEISKLRDKFHKMNNQIHQLKNFELIRDEEERLKRLNTAVQN